MFSSCKKDKQDIDPVIDNGGATGGGISAGAVIQSSVGGVILDENGNAVSGAQVSLGTNVAITNAQGVFLFSGVSMPGDRSYLKVSKNGFFHGSRAFDPEVGRVSNVKITLLSNATVGSFSSSAGGVVSASGVSLTFPTDGVKLASGGAYSGNVNVALKFLDPTQADMANQMPGDLMALNASGDARVLETFGMAAIELTGSAGQKLNVADGKTVEIKVPLSGAYLTDAPATIPLWYFDETNGVWKEEGSASLVGNEYVGSVSHFTFWNCDNPNPSTQVTGKIVCNGQAVQGAIVKMRNPSGRILGRANTDNYGFFDGFIPQNTVLTVIVEDPICAGVLYTANIGPFTSATTLADIEACPVGNYGTISGSVQDCGGAAVSNGAVLVEVGGASLVLFPDASGNVSASLPYCSNTTVDVTGFDYANVKQSGVATINTGATMNFGTLNACNSVDQYINYTLDGTSFSILNVPSGGYTDVYTWGGSTSISGYDQSAGNNINLTVAGDALGTYGVASDSLGVNNLYSAPMGANVNTTFTTYGTATGTYVEGNFSGTFTDGAAASHTLSGNFRLKRP